MNSSDYAITAQNINKTFRLKDRNASALHVLKDISLTVAHGEMVSVVGPSGSGKSTLLYCLSGLDSLTSGKVSLMGKDITEVSRNTLAKLRREHVGFVFQEYNLIPYLNVLENVSLPAKIAKKLVSKKQVYDILRELNIANQAKKVPSLLSGGERQRVAIARSLVSKPNIVFADEPTGALDTATGKQIVLELKKLTQLGQSVVMVTHELDYACYADRVLILIDGKIKQELTKPKPQEILTIIQKHKQAAA